MTEQRSLRGRMGAYRQQALHDTRETTRKAREAAEARFERQARERFPDLPEDEIIRRAEALKKEHFTRMAYLSAAARRRKESA